MTEKETKSIARRAVNFELHDIPGREVFVVGSFNEWKPIKKLEDKHGDGIYRCRMMLYPGEYQYKFMVDGEWRSDAFNPNFMPNEFGSLNSVLIVEKK